MELRKHCEKLAQRFFSVDTAGHQNLSTALEDFAAMIRNRSLEEAANKLFQREKDLGALGPQTYLQQCECNVMARSILQLRTSMPATQEDK